LIDLELGTYHYDATLIVGTTTDDIARAYTDNTDFGVRKGSTVVYFGAGGPMGQTGILWAAALGEEGPGRIVAVDALDDRLEVLKDFARYVPATASLEFHNGLKEELGNFLRPNSVDYLMILAPVPKAIESYMPYMADGSILNFFAGLRNKFAKLDAYDICARRIRLVGHSGDDIPTQKRCLEKILAGKIVTDPVVAAVGGMDSAWDALWATHLGVYPGKICIYPGVRYPLVAVSQLTGREPWNAAFEREFIKRYHW
jgi:threonine dehydrogenase-like Zn-dependent dehydrogenase